MSAERQPRGAHRFQEVPAIEGFVFGRHTESPFLSTHVSWLHGAVGSSLLRRSGPLVLLHRLKYGTYYDARRDWTTAPWRRRENPLKIDAGSHSLQNILSRHDDSISARF